MRAPKLGQALTMTAVVALILGGTACDKPADQAHRLRVGASEFAFSGVPASVPGGLTRLVVTNTGKENHQAILVRLAGDHTAQQAVEAMKAAGPGGPTPGWVLGGGGSETVAPGKSVKVTQNLEQGRYAFLCYLTSEGSTARHYEKGMVKEFRVTAGQAGKLAPADGTITARDYSFDVPGLSAGRRTLEVRNDGPRQPHLFNLQEFPAGVTEAQAQDVLRQAQTGEETSDTAPDPVPVGGFGLLEPGGRGNMEADLKKGRTYVLVCSVSDREGGPPHVSKGMAKVFSIR